MSYLPGVKPWVQKAADEIEERFGPIVQLGVGIRADNPNSDHPKGLAIDNMVGNDKTKGDAIANYAIANASRLGETYVIWYARIWEPSTGWKPYTHPSGGTSRTQLHMDHVHISFLANFTAGASDPVENFGLPGIPGPVAGLAELASAAKRVVDFVTNPQSYVRAAMLIAGITLLVIGLMQIDKVKSTAGTVVRKAANSV